MPKRAKKKDKGESKKHRKKRKINIKKGTYYKIEGEKTIKTKRTCPKCGPDTFLGEHKNRQSCGKCGYSEKKKE
jgi:ubiquitin-small subunit ribosomal protein S27Ae